MHHKYTAHKQQITISYMSHFKCNLNESLYFRTSTFITNVEVHFIHSPSFSISSTVVLSPPHTSIFTNFNSNLTANILSYISRSPTPNILCISTTTYVCHSTLEVFLFHSGVNPWNFEVLCFTYSITVLSKWYHLSLLAHIEYNLYLLSGPSTPVLEWWHEMTNGICQIK